MLVGIQNAVAGLQANDRRMDILGSRLGSDVTVPFPEVLDSSGASTTLPLSLPLRRDEEEKAGLPAPAAESSSSQLPGLLPANTSATLGKGDLARDMGLYLIAQAAYRVNARVFSTANHELIVLTRFGQ
ncbi:MAG TPA: hypothetical protein VJ873_00010 [bacterium]|nr:hypothetical protein [bacterium]